MTKLLTNDVNLTIKKKINHARIAYPQAKIRVFKPLKRLPGYFLGFQYSKEMIEQGEKEAKDVIQNFKF
jgi:hypothetical protein